MNAAGLLACVVLAAPAGESALLASTPAPGTRLARTFELEHRLVLQRLSRTQRGAEELSAAGTPIVGRLALGLGDEVRAVANGRPSVFRRTFAGASLKVDVGGADAKEPRRTLEAGSPLAGASVLYTFAPARGDFGRLYDTREESEEFLGRLGDELEVAWLVPGREVATGETWEIEPGRLGELFAYGGEIPLRFGSGDPIVVRMLSQGAGGPLHAVFGGEVRDTARARLTAIEGSRARIALEIDVRAERDQTARFERELTQTELVSGVGVRAARVAWTFRGSGEAVWDVAGGRVASVALSGAESVKLTGELQGRDGPSTNVAEMSGGLRLDLRVEAPGGVAAPK